MSRDEKKRKIKVLIEISYFLRVLEELMSFPVCF